MMIGQSATGQVQLRFSQKIKTDKIINYLWWWSVNLRLARWNFVPLSIIFDVHWSSFLSLLSSSHFDDRGEVQWCDLLRLWSVQTFCQSLSTHYQGHEIYNLSEKELLYKQRISLELLEVKSILSVAFKFLALALGTTWHSISKALSQICLPQVANRISPGISRLRGVILYELQVEHFQQLWSWSLAWSWLCCWRWLSNHGETSEDLFQ